MTHIKKNDIVVVMTGKDKGKKGKVLRVFPLEKNALVEGVNYIKKHTRRTKQDNPGGIIQKEGPTHISNIMLHCSNCKKPVRTFFKILGDNSKIRLCKKCKQGI